MRINEKKVAWRWQEGIEKRGRILINIVRVFVALLRCYYELTIPALCILSLYHYNIVIPSRWGHMRLRGVIFGKSILLSEQFSRKYLIVGCVSHIER